MKLSLKKILVLAGALLGLVAFIMMFVDQVKVSTTLLGKTNISYVPFADVVGSDDGQAGAGAVVIGYILAILGGLALVVPAFVLKDKKVAMYVTIGCAVLMVVGAVLMFCTSAMYRGALVNNLVDAGANKESAEALVDVSEYALAAGPIVGGILAILGAGCAGASIVVKEK